MRFLLDVVLVTVLAATLGCNGARTSTTAGSPGLDIPDLQPALSLPVFAQQQNEVEIADSMNEVDPTLVLGSIVNIKTGQVSSLDNYLSTSAKPAVILKSEVVFRKLVENAIAVNASYLDFLSGELSDSVRAELSVVKSSKASIKSEDIDKLRIVAEMKRIPVTQRDAFGVIIGYVDFVLSATFFKQLDTQAGASGYGAKIGGKWFSKAEDTAAHHRVVAIWAPLPFVVTELVTPGGEQTPLTEATDRAVQQGHLKSIPRLTSLQVKPYFDRLKKQDR